jgi:acyl carrier protein
MERAELLERLQDIIVEQLDIEPDLITEETSLIDDLGADSLDLLQLITAIEDEFDIQVADEDFESIQTIGDALDQIIGLVG